MKRIQVRVEDKVYAEIERQRGDIPRERFLRSLLALALLSNSVRRKDGSLPSDPRPTGTQGAKK